MLQKRVKHEKRELLTYFDQNQRNRTNSTTTTGDRSELAGTGSTSAAGAVAVAAWPGPVSRDPTFEPNKQDLGLVQTRSWSC